MRDNWCIGFTDRYTVGVWVGNAGGEPMRHVSGTHGAAPKPGGGECAGEVVRVGDGVTGVAVGARMMGRCGGGYA